MKFIVLLTLLGLSFSSFSFDKLILRDDARKVKVKLGYKVSIDLLETEKNKYVPSVSGIVRKINTENITIETSKKRIAVDTIELKDYSRKLKKEGWVIVKSPYGSSSSCDVIIEKYGEGIMRTVAYEEIQSLKIRDLIPPKKFAYFLTSAGLTSAGIAPFTGIRSDRYSWPSFFSFITGGFGTLLAGLIIDANTNDYAYEFQDYQREFK